MPIAVLTASLLSPLVAFATNYLINIISHLGHHHPVVQFDMFHDIRFMFTDSFLDSYLFQSEYYFICCKINNLLECIRYLILAAK